MTTKLTVWALLLPLCMQAQETVPQKNKPAFTLSWTGGFGPGLGEGMGWFAVFVPGKKWTAGLHVSYGGGPATGVPADYDAGLVIWGDGKPAETFWSIGPVVTYIYPFEGRRWLFYTGGGPTLLTVDRITEYIKINNTGWFNSNYNVVIKRETLPGFRADAGFMMRIGRIAGLNFGTFLLTSSWKTTVGFKLGVAFGMHRKLFWK